MSTLPGGLAAEEVMVIRVSALMPDSMRQLGARPFAVIDAEARRGLGARASFDRSWRRLPDAPGAAHLRSRDERRQGTPRDRALEEIVEAPGGRRSDVLALEAAVQRARPRRAVLDGRRFDLEPVAQRSRPSGTARAAGEAGGGLDVADEGGEVIASRRDRRPTVVV